MALFGHKPRFSQRLETSWPRLYRIAYAWTHEPCIAQDLVQETIARALQHKDKINDHPTLEIWLLKVMANYWRDLLRRRKNLTDINEIPLAGADTPESDTERTRLVSQVRNAIARLSNDQRQVITLISIHGCSYEEAAQILQIPVGTVMSRVCRARQNLKKILGEPDTRHASSERVWRLK